MARHTQKCPPMADCAMPKLKPSWNTAYTMRYEEMHPTEPTLLCLLLGLRDQTPGSTNTGLFGLNDYHSYTGGLSIRHVALDVRPVFTSKFN